MIIRKDKNGILRTIRHIYTGKGKEITEVYDNSGKMIFRNWDELTGILPLTFHSDRTNLKDYRIYGNTGGVGEKVNDNLYKIPVTISGKNLFNLSRWEGESVCRMTVNGNSIVGTTGTGYWGMYSLKTFMIEAGTPFSVQLYFVPNGTNYPECLGFKFYDSNRTQVFNFMDKTSGTKKTLICDNDIAYIALGISKLKQNAYNEITDIKIIIESGSEITDYEPYHEPMTTNIYLEQPLQKGESISLSEAGIQIPTISGTNILTVDTEIQPEKVSVRYWK